jgi:hypothetical protein
VSSGWHCELPAINAPLEYLLCSSEQPLCQVPVVSFYGTELDIARSFVEEFNRIRTVSVFFSLLHQQSRLVVG